MKSKIIIFFLIFIYILKANLLIAENLNIKSKKIKIDEKKKVLQFFKIKLKPMTRVKTMFRGIMVNLKKIKKF